MTLDRRRDGFFWKNGRVRHDSSGYPAGQRVPGIIETAITFIRGEPFLYLSDEARKALLGKGRG